MKRSCVGPLLQWFISQGISEFFVNTEGEGEAQKSCESPLSESLLPLIPTFHTELPLPTRGQLYEEMLAFTGCPLSKTAQNMVFSDGNPDSSIVIVGEAPGAEEDRLGKPFVGPSGKLLDLMLAAIGLDRSSVYILNMLPWRPPFNRQPTSEEIALCLPFVEKHIALIAPKLVLFMGGVACKTLMRSAETITALQNRVLTYTNSYIPEGIPGWAFYHPAYLLRSPGQKRRAWKQLLEVQAFLKTHEPLKSFEK